MLERRAKLRAKIALPGHAAFPGAAAGVRCLVVNLSTIGACLSFGTGTRVPKHFSLRIGVDRESYPVRVAWRRESDVGVAFVAPRAGVPDVIHG